MLKNYFKIAFRNLFRQKAYSAINIIGLAVGLACSILIFLWVNDELSYDSFLEDSEQVYRVVEMQKQNGDPFPVAVTPAPLASNLKEDFPEVKESTVLREGFSTTFKVDKKEYRINKVTLVNADFLNFFNFELLKGNFEDFYTKKDEVILSKTTAEKIFGMNDPIGKTITVLKNRKMRVAAVVEDSPDKSHIKYDCLVSLKLMEDFGASLTNWSMNSYYTYVRLRKGTSAQNFTTKITSYLEDHDCGYPVKLYLQKFDDIYLKSDFTADYRDLGDYIYVNIFAIIAFLILFIACINFMNLSTARSVKRSKEVGMRKVIGAQRKNLIFQFILESMIITGLALIIALVLVEFSLSYFNAFTGKQLALNLFSNQKMLLGLMSIFIGTAFIAGSYPAFALSAFKPISVLKRISEKGMKGRLFRKILVIFQFTLSIGLILCTILISKQLSYMRNANLGYNPTNTIYLKWGEETKGDFDDFKNELISLQGVKNVTLANSLPTNIVSSGYGLNWSGKPDEFKPLVHTLTVGDDFFEMFEIKTIKGRAFSPEIDKNKKVIMLNEEAYKLVGEDYPLNGKMTYYNNLDESTFIGVIENFHFKSLHKKVEPLAISYSHSFPGTAFIKIKSDNIQQTLKEIEKTVGRFYRSKPEYKFLDSYFEKQYRNEIKMQGLFEAFTLLTIFISSLGLFGLASFMVEQKTKEIGVRKVLGSSVSSIVILFSKDFVKWILIATLIAWPISYFIMNKWFEFYAYRINIGISSFLAATFIALFIALLTVSGQTYKAANTTPVKTLKDE